jgi:hypothetical protein
MTRFHIIRLTFVVLAVILLLHYVAVTLFLYSYVWWYDIPQHLLGGFASGLFLLWFFSSENRTGGGRMTSLRVMAIALVGAITVGLVWELFEYCAGITQNTIGSYPLDTVKDLAMDITGGYFAHVYYVARVFFNKKS